MSEVKADKGWSIRASDGVSINFTPVFVIQDLKKGDINTTTANKEVECTMIHVKMTDSKGKHTTMDLGFQEIFMFMYYCANEELRRALQLRIERNITEIPYEVTFKLDKGEIEAGMAKRLIKLPVDEITMAAARANAQMMKGTANLDTINEWFKKRTQSRKGRNRLMEKR